MTRGRDAIGLLRAVGSAATLPAAIAEAAVLAGFDRATLSDVRDRRWVPIAQHSRHGHDPRTHKLLEVGRTDPPLLDHRLIETRMLRDGEPRLVADALVDPAVHRRMRAVVETDSYVAAPIVVDGDAVALVHADLADRRERCDVDHRDLLAIVAEAAGASWERLVLLDSLHDLRERVEHMRETALAVVDEHYWPTASAADLVVPRP